MPVHIWWNSYHKLAAELSGCNWFRHWLFAGYHIGYNFSNNFTDTFQRCFLTAASQLTLGNSAQSATYSPSSSDQVMR